MKHIILLVVFVMGIVFIQFAQGQTADEIINKYLDARGGKEKINAISSLYMEGSRQMMGNEVPVKVTIVQGKLYRNDFEFGGKTGYTIVTTTEGWSFIPMRSDKADPIPADRLKTMQSQLDIAGPLVDYASKGNKIELQGKETIEGKDCFKIKLTLANGKESTFYFDSKTYLLVESKAMVAGMGGGAERELITTYADYSAVDGVQFPHTISNPGGGQGGGSTTFDKIELNKKIDDSQYKPSK